MSYPTSSQRMADAMTRALRHWQYEGKGEMAEAIATQPPPSFCIAISRQAGAKGSTIAKAVGERLGWPVYDRELIEKVAQEMGLRTHQVESVDERQEGWLQECFAAFASRPGVSQSAYTHHLVRVLLSLAADGECVIVGRGANCVLPEATTLRVRLVAPLAARIAAFAKRKGLSAEEARRETEKTEEQRIRFIRDNFRKDANDPLEYDLVLNTGRLSEEECANLIVAALAKFKETRASVRR